MQPSITPPKPGELSKKGFTNKIKIADSQTAQSLTEYGFTNHHKPSLYFARQLREDLSFNLRVDKKSLEITGIDILDEAFLQPYDYQAQIMDGKPSKAARETFERVNRILSALQDDGVITGYTVGMYV